MIDTQESVTAKLCSFARAFHSNYSKEKIFDDYLAFDLMGKEEYEKIGQLIEGHFIPMDYDPARSFRREVVSHNLSEYIAPIPLSRISFAEQKLIQFAKGHESCQYVICGAGMDTFAFRNENPHIQIFELDHPDTQAYKRKRIQELKWNIPRNVQFVPINFETEDMKTVLVRAGFHPQIPTFFCILGVTYYLPLSVFEETIKHIAKLSSMGSLLVFDYPDETTLDTDNSVERVRKLAEVTASLGEEMREGFSLRSIEEALAEHDFSIDRHMPPQEIQNTFFGNCEDNYRAFENVHFISAIYEGEES